MLKRKNMQGHIDTEQIRGYADGGKTILEINSMIGFSKCHRGDNDDIRVKIKPSEYNKNRVVNSMSQHLDIKNNMIESAKLENVSNNRIDYAIDINRPFADIEKLLLSLMGCISVTEGARDFLRTHNVFKMKDTRSYLVKKGRNDYVAYDKEKQTNGVMKGITRIEFRYKDIRSASGENEVEYINKAMTTLDKCIGGFDGLNKKLSDMLVREYKTNKYKTFTGFVRANNVYFVNMEVFKMVQEQLGIKTKANTWLSNYRKGDKLEFVTKKHIVNTIKEIKATTKKYIKG